MNEHTGLRLRSSRPQEVASFPGRVWRSDNSVILLASEVVTTARYCKRLKCDIPFRPRQKSMADCTTSVLPAQSITDFQYCNCGSVSKLWAIYSAKRDHIAGQRIAGQRIALPSLDIVTLGAGGGSIARVDAGGVLHVGPESAGAAPGPAC